MKTRKLLERVMQSKPFLQCEEMVSSLKDGDELVLMNAGGSLPAFITQLLVEKSTRKIFLVVGDSMRVERFYDDCCLLVGKEQVLLFADHLHHRNAMVINDEGNTVELLYQLIEQQPTIVITHAAVIAKKFPQPKILQNKSLEILRDKEISFHNVLEILEQWEFEKVDFVATSGQYSVRGGILDVFSFGGMQPVRIEFFGDTVTSLREFDTRSQRSIRTLTKTVVHPNAFQSKKENVLHSNSSSVFDYLQPETLLIYDEPFILEREIS